LLYRKILDIDQAQLDYNARYLAGLMDGEGSFLIIARITEKRRVSFSPCISLKMTHEETIKFAADKFGVNYFPRKGKPGHKDIFDCRVTTKDEIRQICNALSPYSITKKEPIKWLLDYLSEAERRERLTLSQKRSLEDKGILLGIVDLHIASKKANQRGTKIVDYEARRKELKDVINASSASAIHSTELET